ncbi:MAG: hypothetical protein V3S14_09105, partial [Anaerolineae bacterium]
MVDDSAIEGLHPGVISHTATSADSIYNSLSAINATATITDNDGVFSNVLESKAYRLVYALDILTNTDYNSGSPAYFIDNSATVGTFDRVAYYMALNDDIWNYVSMPAFTSTVEHIGVPVQNLSVTLVFTTSDMNVRTTSPGADPDAVGDGLSGNVEFWPHAYSPISNTAITDQFGVPIGSDALFDSNDSIITNTSSYSGSFQIHVWNCDIDVGSECPIIAWSNWDSPAVDDMQGGVWKNDDGTGAGEATLFLTRTLYILARETGGAMAMAAAMGKEPALRRPPSVSRGVVEGSPTEPLSSRVPAGPQSAANVDTFSTPGQQSVEFDPVLQAYLEHFEAREREEAKVATTNEAAVAAISISRGMETTPTTTTQDRPVIHGYSGGLKYTIVGNPNSRVVFRRADTQTGYSAILTPTFPAAVTSTQVISIAGFVASDQDVRALDVTVDGSTIYTQPWGAGITETTWATTWTPPGEGIYTLEAALTNGIAQVITDTAETLIYVDLNDPSVSLGTQRVNAANFYVGRIVITGTATDTVGLARVEARVGDGPWQTANLLTQAPNTPTPYTVTLAITLTDVPTNTSYVVSARAIDRGGHSALVQHTLPADAVAPTLGDLSLSADGQPVAQGDTVDWAANPILSLSWDAASDANGVA